MSQAEKLIPILQRISDGTSTDNDSTLLTIAMISSFVLHHDYLSAAQLSQHLMKKGVTQEDVTRITAEFHGIDENELKEMIDDCYTAILLSESPPPEQQN